MRTIDLAAQNVMAVRTKVLDHGTSANGKSTPASAEAWSIHARKVSSEGKLAPDEKLGEVVLRKHAGKWTASGGSGQIGEAARLLALTRAHP